ncbi:uncharacterized protein C7orf57 homolog [Dendronephthya gigantea]|uniref:uncharacterized protein C7orf57 homolog n=1 Tax=Dendronephthya gigantea TaxID=151771 RepID=UPI00106B6C25|nr:uncharacterized protein C7orf57 homolog [Dendronephthya gigantea]
MPNPHISTQDWFYHIPAARSKNPPSIIAPIQSQIPGLGNIPEGAIPNDNDKHFKRKWFRDTDSKYVKLAKAGGRKNLLSFMPGKLSSEPVLYPRVDWFDHHGDHEENTNYKQKSTTDYVVLPEWYIHNESVDDHNDADVSMDTTENQLSNGQNSKKKPMIGDSMTVWQRESKEAADEALQKKPIKLPKICKNNATKKGKALKETPKLKSNVAVLDDSQDMRRLLSMDYQREWLSNKSAEYTKEMKAQIILEKERQARTRRIGKRFRDSLKPKKEIVEEKPLFKLSRFNKVKSCVDTRWSRLESEDKSMAH